jgi:hypothetical protein
VLRRRKVEAHGDFILGPVSPKEYKDTVAELNGSRTNRVFEFFKITPPERVGFAKHREAAEKKAAAVAAAEADAEETATSLRATPQKTGRRSAPATATAAAEGKARKKRGGQPADSPSSPKRTRVVDVKTGLVEDVIAAVPLRAAAPLDVPSGVPSARAGQGAAGPLLVPLSPSEKDSDDDSDVRIVSSVGDAPRKPSPAPSAPKPHKRRMIPAPPPAARPTHPPVAPSNPPPLRPLLLIEMMSSPKRRRGRTRGPRAAAIG